MLRDISSLQLSWVRREVGRLVNVYRRWLTRISDQKDGTIPEAELEVHICVAQIRTEVDSVGRRHFVEVNATRRWRSRE